MMLDMDLKKSLDQLSLIISKAKALTLVALLGDIHDHTPQIVTSYLDVLHDLFDMADQLCTGIQKDIRHNLHLT